jgi:hypothetical protein
MKCIFNTVLQRLLVTLLQLERLFAQMPQRDFSWEWPRL